MDEARRLHYLDAMGITVWRLRNAAETAAADAPEPPGQAGAGASTATGHTPAPPASVATTPATDAGTAPAAAAARPIPAEPPAAREPAAASPTSASQRSEQAPPPRPAGGQPPPPPATDNGAFPDEPPPWSDDDLAGLPFDDAPLTPDLFPDAPAAAPPPNPVAGMDWPALKDAVAGCRACGLCQRRTNTVFGVGDENAELMFIGEGPGQDEDRQGEPFVGRAGQLLNRMLAAVDLKREQVYIANIVKCRPPNNRNPNPDEAAACRAYLDRQIALIRPRLIVSLGAVSANNLLGNTDSVGRLRGRGHQYQPPDGSPPIPLLVTYHPSYYLRSPAEKAKGWQDLQRIVRTLRGQG
jgi:DNA polymerase